MNPFVNPQKRSILLPGGCKDLIDILQPHKRARHAQANFAGDWAPIVQPERIEAAGLAHVHHYLATLLESRGQFAALHITSLDADMRVVLYKSADEFNVFPVMGIVDKERAVEDFFAQLAIQPSADFSIGHAGMPTRVLAFPLPFDVSKAAQLTIDLIRSVYGLDDQAGLEFTHVKIDAAC